MDELELKDFYEANKADVYRLAFSYLRNGSEAEDVVHEALLRFYRHEPKDAAKARPYFFSVVVRLSLDVLSSRKKVAAPPEEGKEPTPGSDYRFLYEAIDELGKKERSIIRLHYFAGLSLQEIARATGLSLNATKKRLERARKALKEKL